MAYGAKATVTLAPHSCHFCLTFSHRCVILYYTAHYLDLMLLIFTSFYCRNTTQSQYFNKSFMLTSAKCLHKHAGKSSMFMSPCPLFPVPASRLVLSDWWKITFIPVAHWPVWLKSPPTPQTVISSPYRSEAYQRKPPITVLSSTVCIWALRIFFFFFAIRSNFNKLTSGCGRAGSAECITKGSRCIGVVLIKIEMNVSLAPHGRVATLFHQNWWSTSDTV